ncbi:MAG: SIMPL domain-containing protein [Bacteroidia bacterium]
MKKINCLLLIGLILIISGSLGAQTFDKNEQPYIEVSGTAEKLIIPDEIYISITLYDRYVHNTREKVSVEEQEVKLKEAIKTQGISLTNLYLADATSDVVKVQWKKPELITKKNYTLKISDALTLGKIYSELDKLQIQDAHISKVSHSKMDSLKREVKIAAIKVAKQKADYLLEAIGEQTGKPLIVRDSDPAYYSGETNIYVNNSYSASNYTDASKLKTEENSTLQFQKIKIVSTTYVKFSIK